MKKKHIALISPLSVLFFSSLSYAQTEQLDEIQVTTQTGEATDPLSGTTKPYEIVVNKDKLQQKASTLGNALANEIGVHSSQFGGGSSAPVIRGQEGVRLKILQNGLDVVDMSQLSPDHAIAADTLLANKVEIVRGASTLLYATASPAGVINVIDNRIPTFMPDKGYSVDMGLRYNANNQEKVMNGAFTLGIGKHIALRAEGLYRNAHNYKVPTLQFNDQSVNYLPNSQNKSKVGTIGASYITDNGYIGLSYSERYDRYGLVGHNHKFDSCDGHIFDDFNDDYSYHYYLSSYPHLIDDNDVKHNAHFHCGSGHESDPHPSHRHPFGADITGGPWIDLKLKRYEAKSEFKLPSRWLSKVKISYAHSNYYHDEKEQEDIPVNLFYNQANNVRLELFHQPTDNLSGVIGVQYQEQHSRANIPRLKQAPTLSLDGVPSWLLPDEPIVTPKSGWGEPIDDRTHWALIDNKNKQLSFFAMEQLRWKDFLFEIAARTEKQRIDIDYDRERLHKLKLKAQRDWSYSRIVDPDLNLYNHRATSYAGAVHWFLPSDYTVSLIFSHNERLPTPMELYYHGKHLATNSFEYGNKDLHKEVSNNIELSFSRQNPRWNYNLSLYYNHFSNRIFKRTLDKEGNLSMNRYAQAKADYYGIEGKLDYQLDPNLQVGIWADYVRGVLHNLPPLQLDNINNLHYVEASKNAPRVPPTRIGMHINKQWTDDLSTNVDFTHVFAQRKTATLESSTDGYNLLTALISYKAKIKQMDYTFFIQGDNLLNQKIYSHTSYLSFVPQMGRNISIGMNMSF
ncbi:MAG: TonB-dependent receptor [Pasteurellaceae bacterium]|nr:TonB-dependent receptor [Pasteurellaceae bacterium]